MNEHCFFHLPLLVLYAQKK